MKKYVILAVVCVVVVCAIGVVSMWVNYSNKEIQIRNLITAKMQDNQSEYDNMWKKISQVSQVAVKDRKSLMEIFNSYASSRSGNGDNKAVQKWIWEAVPNISQESFANLQNVITSSRDVWTMRQKELIDYKREHDNLRKLFPSCIFVGNRPEIKIVIITSEKTENTFKTGKDNDVDVFGK